MKKHHGVTLIIGLIAGFAGGWFVHAKHAENELRGVIVAQQLERVSFSTNTLAQLPNESGKAHDLQLLVLRSSLTELDRLSAQGSVVFPGNVPSLREGLRRARAYAESNNLPDLADKARIVSERLFPGA